MQMILTLGKPANSVGMKHLISSGVKSPRCVLVFVAY